VHVVCCDEWTLPTSSAEDILFWMRGLRLRSRHFTQNENIWKEEYEPNIHFLLFSIF